MAQEAFASSASFGHRGPEQRCARAACGLSESRATGREAQQRPGPLVPVRNLVHMSGLSADHMGVGRRKAFGPAGRGMLPAPPLH